MASSISISFILFSPHSLQF